MIEPTPGSIKSMLRPYSEKLTDPDPLRQSDLRMLQGIHREGMRHELANDILFAMFHAWKRGEDMNRAAIVAMYCATELYSDKA